MNQTRESIHNKYPFLQGGGDMGAFIRELNWADTLLGEPSRWSSALRQNVNMMLTTNFPMLICWGDDYTQLYNDAFRPILGESKHPDAMGGSAKATYAEIWDTIGPMFAGVMAGTPVGFPDFMVVLNRYGYPEDCYFDFSYSPIQDDDGIIKGVRVICVETTEKVRALENLKAQQENIRNMVLQAPVGMCIVKGERLRVEEVNDLFLEIAGKTRRQMLLAPYWEVIPEVADFYEPITRRVMETGETYKGKEHKVTLNRNGKEEVVYIDFVYEPVKNTDGKVDGIMIVAIEVTEQVNARKKVEQAEQNLRMAIEAAELGSYSINTEDRIFIASPRLKEFFGFGPDEDVSYEAAINQIHEDYRQQAANLIEAAITKGTRFDTEYPIIGHNDGKIRWVRSVGTLQHGGDGKSYLTGVLHDISEKKQDEIRKNDFIGMVSHELKTPLTSLSAYLQVLQQKAKKDEDNFSLKALDQSVKQTRKMTVMINGFLNVSRLESGKIHIDRQRFDMAGLMKETEAETRAMTASHNFIFAPVDEIFVCADREKISHVISNFISNAVKYSRPGSTIQLACIKVDGSAQVSVRDKGIGIGPDDLEQLFTRYYRVASTSHVSGFGIGLYLSSEIITRHDGHIWAESELGEGSAFYFTLPLAG